MQYVLLKIDKLGVEQTASHPKARIAHCKRETLLRGEEIGSVAKGDLYARKMVTLFMRFGADAVWGK